MKDIRHLIDVSDLSIEEIDALIESAEDIMANRENYSHSCEGKK